MKANGTKHRDEVQAERQQRQQREHGDEHQADHRVLLLQVGHRAFLHRLADLLHPARAGVLPHHGDGLVQGEEQRGDRPDPGDPHQVGRAGPAPLGEGPRERQHEEDRGDRENPTCAFHGDSFRKNHGARGVAEARRPPRQGRYAAVL